MRKYIMYIFGWLRLLKELMWGRGGLKIHGIKYYLGKNVKCWIHNGGAVDLGEKTWLSDNCALEAAGGKIKLGYNNFFNANCRITSMDHVKIGDNNLFGPNVVIVDHDHNYHDRDKLICKQGFLINAVSIGSDCWICANVVITKGTRINDGVVVAANSVVKGSLEQPGLYAGVPAKLIKERKNN